MERDLTARPTPHEDEERGRPILAPDQRRLLWAAVCEAAGKLRGRLTVCPKGSTTPIRASDSISNVKDWQLAEALALLCLLLNTARVDAQSVTLFEALRAVTIGERGRTLHLWFQPQTRGHVTNLQAKPDIAVTFRPVCDATGGNIQRVVEVKHVRKLRSLSVRQEFAKAFDLSVCSYCLLTYFPIPANIRSGADKFGLDVAELFIKPGMTPAELVSHVCERLKESRNAERFTTNLKTRYEDYQRKQLTFNP